MKKENFNITYLEEGSQKNLGLPFLRAKEMVLGEDYDLSLVFADNKTSEKLHNEFMGEKSPANVLSFPLSKESGEIFIDPKEAARNAPSFEKKMPDFILCLFIHGLLHLKGLSHGSKMESEERRLEKIFGV